MRRNTQQGVALVVTLILLSVITFLAITFLIVSRRESASVTGMTDQTAARLAADSAVERAIVEMLAPMLVYTNPLAFDLRVSTNYINPFGFDPANGGSLTNVSYAYGDGQPVTGNDFLQNLANLFYNPRPPVFITANRNQTTPGFRFYIDLNRNGRYDTNGLGLVLDDLGNPILDAINQRVTNFFVGDPEWIGLLERPEFPHSATNKFIARYAYLVLPAGKALDLNYVHNQAKMLGRTTEGFFRNQGVGTWEINLAAFLADLNTNLWNPPPISPYTYNINSFPSSGAAFADALSLLRYRYSPTGRSTDSDYNTLQNVHDFFGGAADVPFRTDLVDEYANGPLMANTWLLPDNDTDDPQKPWPGSDNTNHFFTTQELFDPLKISNFFTNRLLTAGVRSNSYDRYTFYRLLSQMGTDSGLESGKINLNYVNVDTAGNIVPSLAESFSPWAPIQFFTNAADRMLRFQTTNWFRANPSNFLWTYYGYTGYTNQDEVGLTNRPYFGMTNQVPAFGITDVPLSWDGTNYVYSANYWERVGDRVYAYTPAVHRLLQLAGNLYDATTNRPDTVNPPFPHLPSVFRPIFRRDGAGNIRIAGYVEEQDDRLVAAPPFFVDLSDPASRNQIRPVSQTINPNDASEPMVYGVPVIVGAKKGLPNFNEFALQSIMLVTRKLWFEKAKTNGPVMKLGHMYVVGATNVFGVEAWNSYASAYPRDLAISVTGEVTTVLANLDGVVLDGAGNRMSNRIVFGAITSISATDPAKKWLGYTLYGDPRLSFRIPVRSGSNGFPTSIYWLTGTKGSGSLRNLTTGFQSTDGQVYPVPRLWLTTSARLQCSIVDTAAGRIVDYVNLGEMSRTVSLDSILYANTSGTCCEGAWRTNLVTPGGRYFPVPVPEGFVQQVEASLENCDCSSAQWTSYSDGSVSVNDKPMSIDLFRVFGGLSAIHYPNLTLAGNTNLVMQAPFCPARRFYMQASWQANDPLVHYTASDLTDLQHATEVKFIRPPNLIRTNDLLPNLGQVNGRYSPWPVDPTAATTDPNAFNLAFKDPLVRRSDDWDFPTNKFPNIGWLGRVHRGTPWQTIYLKSADIADTVPPVPADPYKDLRAWQLWTGNDKISSYDGRTADAWRTKPTNDWALLDLFTTAPNENAARGQLSINQTELAAWSAVLSGVVTLTNTVSDAQFRANPRQQPLFDWRVIEPAGVYNPYAPDTWPPLIKIVAAINDVRATNAHFGGTFKSLGDILSVPELTVASPFLNLSTAQKQKGISDAVYERIPQQILSLLRVGEPRFVIYAYGQALKPAAQSLVTTRGRFYGMFTNYQITAETATRSVVRIEGDWTKPDAPRHAITESFNILPPD